FESDFILALQNEARLHRLPSAILRLIGDGLVQFHRPRAGGKNQVSRFVGAHAVGALEAQRDRLRVGSRAYQVVELQLFRGAMEREIDSGINVAIVYPAIERNV